MTWWVWLLLGLGLLPAKAGTTMILPTNLADVAAMVQTAMSAVKQAQAPLPPAVPPPAR